MDPIWIALMQTLARWRIRRGLNSRVLSGLPLIHCGYMW